MNPFDLLKVGAALGFAYAVFRRMSKDVNGIGYKTRELERKRVRDLAVEIEINAENPAAVRRLAKWLYESA